ncbi:homoserine dehydrogenase [Marinoscillum furvescens]|uniref:Homoserine dehydrogenase n=1 Tax=Marinoscillum furvescens DSM 4134 TaxID=1122208 RepID=A0A3D9L3H6_MARFU|nr:homoserine dehydrogenase [Marinoscillum furvescens]RED99846.1 homoserine dehydrogenase [Marinoscillum furvescens DSM 4134]
MTQKIGLIGYGVVAKGFYQLLSQSDLPAEVARICIKNTDKQRDIDQGLFTTNAQELVTDPNIDIIVELIDDAQASFQIVEQALNHGKPVITANKKMIAENLKQVNQWHQMLEAPLLYEASVAGSIPILSTLNQFYRHQEVTQIRGILNGSSNYILSKMRLQKLSMDEALQLAQKNGFAESDPSLDISGKDALYKLVILSYHAFGELTTSFDHIRLESITNMEDQFFDLAAQQGMKIKSIATATKKADKIQLKVQPELVNIEDPLFNIEDENNAIHINGASSGPQLYTGKGAGSHPTGAAVMQDLHLLLHGFRYTIRAPKNTAAAPPIETI